MNIGEILYWSLCAAVVFMLGVLAGIMLGAPKHGDSSSDWWARYNAYLGSPEWQIKRQGVLLRSGGRCEQCGQRKPIQVHHLPGSYRLIPHERPWDLAALCFDCHKEEHAQ